MAKVRKVDSVAPPVVRERERRRKVRRSRLPVARLADPERVDPMAAVRVARVVLVGRVDSVGEDPKVAASAARW